MTGGNHSCKMVNVFVALQENLITVRNCVMATLDEAAVDWGFAITAALSDPCHIG